MSNSCGEIDCSKIIDWTDLMTSAFHGRNNVEKLLRQGCEINQVDSNGCDALMLAAQSGHESIVDILLKYGSDVNKTRLDGCDALMLACENGHKATAKLLLKNGANLSRINKDGMNALMLASSNGRFAIVKLLLKNKADIDQTNNIGDDAIMCACAKGHKEVVNLLIMFVCRPLGKNRVEPLFENSVNLRRVDRLGFNALMIASLFGQKEIVELLLEHNVDTNQTDYTGEDSLMFACRMGYKDVVELLIKYGAHFRNVKFDGFNGLMLASQNGHKEIVELLLQNKADLNQNDNHGNDSLMIACKYGNKEVVEVLIKNGANLSRINIDKCNGLMLAVVNGQTEVVELLLENKADFNQTDLNGNDSLMLACATGHKEVVEQLIKNEAYLSSVNNEGFTGLMLAAIKGYTEIVELLLQNKADVNQSDNDGNDSFMLACGNGNKEVVELLINYGVNFNNVNNEGFNCLMQASQYGHIEIVQLLLDNNVDYNQRGNNGYDSLMLACAYGHKEVAELLIKKGADFSIVNQEGSTSLMCACMCGRKDVVELLLEYNADLNQTGYNGYDSLMGASAKGHKEVVELLIKNGANLSRVSAEGLNCLMLAAFNGHKEVVEFLLQNKADYNQTSNNGLDTLMIACAKGHKEMVELLIKNGADFSKINREGLNSLRLAIQNNHIEIIQLLLDYHADINETDIYGHDSLMYACLKGQKDVVELLINAGASFERVNIDGSNALMIASHFGHFEIVSLLISLGADIHVTNKHENDSLKMASINGHTKVVEILLNAGADCQRMNRDGNDALSLATENGHVNTVKLLLTKRGETNKNAGIFNTAAIEAETIYMLRLCFIAFENRQVTIINVLEEYFDTWFKHETSCDEVQDICNKYKQIAKLLHMNLEEDNENTSTGMYVLETITMLISQADHGDTESIDFGMRSLACYFSIILQRRSNQNPIYEELLEMAANTTKEFISMNRYNKLQLYIYNTCLHRIYSAFEEYYNDKMPALFSLLLEVTYVERTIETIKEFNLFDLRDTGFPFFLVHEILFMLVIGLQNCDEFALRLAECSMCNLIVDFFKLNSNVQNKQMIYYTTQPLLSISMHIALLKGGMKYLNSSNLLNVIEEYAHYSPSCANTVFMLKHPLIQLARSNTSVDEASESDGAFDKIWESFKRLLRYNNKYSKKVVRSEYFHEMRKYTTSNPPAEKLLSVFNIFGLSNALNDARENGIFGENIDHYDALQKGLQAFLTPTGMAQFYQTVNGNANSLEWPWLLSKSTGILPTQKDEFLSSEFPAEFTIETEILGQGAFGSVHLVKDRINPDDKKFVAKKILQAGMQSIESLKQEATILLKARHRRIVQFHGFQKKEHGLLIFLEYVEKGSLASFINSRTFLDEETTRRFTIQILDGLLYLHQNKILHRDIKASNILMEDNQNVKITDFGISELIDGNGVVSGVGTINYMAPEVIYTEGNRVFNYTIKSDIWSVGCTAVEMLTGKPPNSSLLPVQIQFRVRSKKPLIYEIPQWTSVELKQFLDKVLNWEANRRPSAYELLTTDLFVLPKQGQDVLYSILTEVVDFK